MNKLLKLLFSINLKKIFFLLITLILSTGIFAQTELEIRTSGQYLTGIGEAKNLKEAKDFAVSDLIDGIQLSIINKSEYNVEEDNEEVFENFQKSIRRFTSLKLQGLEFVENEISEGGYRVLAYVSREDYNRTIESTRNDITDNTRIAEMIEIDGGLVDGIPYYYQSYLKTYYCPEHIEYVSSIDSIKYNNVKNFLDSKIRMYLLKIDVKVGEPYCDHTTPEQINIPVDVSYNGDPVNKLLANLELPGNSIREIENGETELFLIRELSRVKEKFKVNLFVDFQGDDNLESVNEIFKISENKTIEIDFSEILSVDFEVEEKNDKVFEFKPVLKKISINRIKWDFGDGEFSYEMEPTHLYDIADSFWVSLQINDSPNLVARKMIHIEDEEAESKEDTVLVEVEPVNAFVDTLENKAVKELSKAEDFKKVTQLLNMYKDKGDLTFGKVSDFNKPEKCYIIIIDPQTRKSIAVLTPGEKKRVNLKSKETVNNFKSKYKGNAIIWVKIL